MMFVDDILLNAISIYPKVPIAKTYSDLECVFDRSGEVTPWVRCSRFPNVARVDPEYLQVWP